MVEPPRTTMVKRTIMSVVVTITCFCSLSNSRCRLSANAIAPRKPAITSPSVYTRRQLLGHLVAEIVHGTMTYDKTKGLVTLMIMFGYVMHHNNLYVNTPTRPEHGYYYVIHLNQICYINIHTEQSIIRQVGTSFNVKTQVQFVITVHSATNTKYRQSFHLQKNVSTILCNVCQTKLQA